MEELTVSRRTAALKCLRNEIYQITGLAKGQLEYLLNN